MVIVGAVLAVFRMSISGGCVFAAIVVPALGRAYWAETLRKRAGGGGAQGDAVGTYFVSLMIMVLLAGFSWAVAGAAFVVAWLATEWNSPGHGLLVLATLVFSAVYMSLFWLTRPRMQHYVP
ncbi:MAG TPA: hypothetical protein VFB96_09465 [Pirellulaceae bacterium]|nr:hypothetical protein [Pirellulaceae bacterium]